MLDGEQLELALEFKYLGHILEDKEMENAECISKDVNGKEVDLKINWIESVKW